jgi:hypothetical protein
MKLNKSKISTQKFNIDDFWDDCIQKDKKENNFLFKMPTEKIKLIKKLPYNNKTYINNCYKKFCLKNPNLFQEEKKNKIHKKRQRNSIKRTLLLYSYGLEQKKLTESIYNENKIKKEQDELKLCTWKPKLYKPNQTSSNFIKKIDKPRISQTNKALEIITNRECTFKPKTNNDNNKRKDLSKIFNKSKSVIMYTDRENFSFMMRYKKARDEHILKRFRKLSVKDESYRNSFFELTSRDCEQNYKNYLNVNNHIDMYDIELKANYNDNKYIFDLSAGNYSNLLKSKNPSSINNNKKMKAKKYYKGILKKQLSLIDLESM